MSLIMQDEFAEMIFDDFDVYIKPKLDLDLSRDPSRLHEIVQAGYDETRRTLPAIRAVLEAAATPRPRRARRKRGSSAADLDAEIED